MIESLEPRIAPAAVVTYTDLDGDKVTISTSAGSDADLSSVVVLSALAAQVEVRSINLAAKANIFAGTSLVVSVERGATGDGLAHIGAIKATGIDLGKVKIAGDLGQIDVGNASNSSPAFISLQVASMGRFGLATQGGMGDLTSEIAGAAGTIKVRTNLEGITLQSSGFLPAVQVSGSVGSSTITSALGIGTIAIKGALRDSVISSTSAEQFTSVQIGRSMIGGRIVSAGGLDSLKIGGDLLGREMGQTGFINITAGNLAKVTIGGDVVGTSFSQTGSLSVAGDLKGLVIGGALRGGDTSGFSSTSAVISAGGDIGKVVIRGSVTTDAPTEAKGSSAQIRATGRIGSVFIGGDVDVLRSTTFDNNLAAPGVRAGEDIGSVTIAGDVRGGSTGKSVLISAFGESSPAPGTNLAIAKVKVGGSATGLIVAAGIGISGNLFIDDGNADAQIGTVQVGGDWINGSIIAGVSPNGFTVADANDTVHPGGLQATIASISKIIIRGGVIGDTVLGSTTFGFVAQHIGSVSIAGSSVSLNPLGEAKDVISIGRTPAKFTIREV